MNTVPVSSRAHALKESRAHVRRCKKTLLIGTDGYPLRRYYTDLDFYGSVYISWEVTLITGPAVFLPDIPGDFSVMTQALPYLRIDNRQRWIDDFVSGGGSFDGLIEGADYPDAAGRFWTNVYNLQFIGHAGAAYQDDIFMANQAPMRVAPALPVLLADFTTFDYFSVFFQAVTEYGNPLTEDMVFMTGNGRSLVESFTIYDLGPAYMNPFSDDRAEWITNRDVQPGNAYYQQPSIPYPPGLTAPAFPGFFNGPSFPNFTLYHNGDPTVAGLEASSPTDPGYPHVPIPGPNKTLWGIYVRLKDTIVETNPQIGCTVHGGAGSLVVYACYAMNVVL